MVGNDLFLVEKQTDAARQRVNKRIDYACAEAKLEISAMAATAIKAINRRAGQHKRRLMERLGD